MIIDKYDNKIVFSEIVGADELHLESIKRDIGLDDLYRDGDDGELIAIGKAIPLDKITRLLTNIHTTNTIIKPDIKFDKPTFARGEQIVLDDTVSELETTLKVNGERFKVYDYLNNRTHQLWYTKIS